MRGRIAGIGLLLMAASVAFTHSIQSVQGADEPISLQKQLETGLRARRPEEFAFIYLVVLRVEQGELPRRLVQETFAWARKKEPYPFVYFERALRIRAARQGISLD